MYRFIVIFTCPGTIGLCWYKLGSSWHACKNVISFKCTFLQPYRWEFGAGTPQFERTGPDEQQHPGTGKYISAAAKYLIVFLSLSWFRWKQSISLLVLLEMKGLKVLLGYSVFLE